MKIGIIGLGVVGSAVREGFERIGHEVKGHDTKIPDSRIESLMDTEVNFICVPTRTDEDGVCDTSIVEAVVDTLAGHGYAGVVAIKSTVTPGLSDSLAQKHPGMRIAFCPEFLRERAAAVDFFENHDICAIGAKTDEDYDIVQAAHGSIPRAFARLTPKEAEFVKYFSNVFNALRITFANEFYEVCKASGVDYSKVKGAVVQRDNIQDAYLDCTDDVRGFGGVCLPKDTRAFARYTKSLGLDHLKLFETIVEENRKFRTTVFEGMRA